VSDESQWRRCSACKKPIAFGAPHWVCNVSTCNRKRTGLVFCTVSCWEVHLPVAKHRQSWAVEATAPTRAQARADGSGAAQPAAAAPREKRRILPATQASAARREVPREVLIVASRLKEYVRLRSGFNTSERVLEPLSEIVRRVCDRALENAEREGRRTLLDRDIPLDE
jgi:hypothetical protein